ncbi:MAG TPA: alpha/beta hydrolase fold domain-containing protein [Aquella sp.]|nr:alpha/beta hydrolase fold domain-containing protein [Aquella sp.]
MNQGINLATKTFITQMLSQRTSQSSIEMSIEDFRKLQSELNSNFGGKVSANIITTNDRIQLKEHNISVCIHRPIDYKYGMPTLIYVAGGAFVTSGLNNIAPTRMAKNCQVIVIGHRLAPECKIAECIDDVALSIEKLIENASQFNIQGSIIIGGDSSGASFALSAMIKLRDAKSSVFNKINRMVFISPAVDLSMAQNTMKEWDDQDVLFSLDAVKAVQKWLSAENFKNPVVSPIYTPSFSGLPQCEIIVAEYDRLRSHADSLYKKLLHDGVAVSVPHVCEGQVHAFLNLRGILTEGEDPAIVLNQMITNLKTKT